MMKTIDVLRPGDVILSPSGQRRKIERISVTYTKSAMDGRWWLTMTDGSAIGWCTPSTEFEAL